jgi:hypothetical protein
MSQNFSDSANIVNVSAIVLFQKAGISDRYIDFGNMTQVSAVSGIKSMEAYFSINGFLQLAKKVVSTVAPVFTITCDEFPVENLALLYGASTNKVALAQTLSASATITVTNIAPYDVVRIPVENPTIISVTVNAIASVQGVDYDLVGGGMKASAVRFRSGSAQVVGTTTAVITYSTPTYTAAGIPRIWKVDTFNQMTISGYTEITLTDAFATTFDHRITGNCYLSPSKYPDYKPDGFASCEFTLSMVGPGNLQQVEN